MPIRGLAYIITGSRRSKKPWLSTSYTCIAHVFNLNYVVTEFDSEALHYAAPCCRHPLNYIYESVCD